MLNKKQKLAAFHLEGNALLSACPGSGKTKTLIARAENKLESIPDDKSLALITYTNAAADEMAVRIGIDNKVFIGTIHRFCLEYILRPFGWLFSWKKPLVVSYDQLMFFVESNEDIDLGDNPLDELNKIKRNTSGDIDLEIDWDNETELEIVADKYFSFLESINSIDFNEILYRSYKLLSKFEFIPMSLGSKFYEILIDEYQDTNTFQYEIFKIIHKHGSSTFFMVGDERQQIFKFAGAIDNSFQCATEDFDARTENLEETYRSTENIIRAYSKLFENHPTLINNSKYKYLDVPINFIETTNANHKFQLCECIRSLIEEKRLLESDIAILSTRWWDSYNASRALRKDYNIVGLGALPHSVRNLNNSTFSLFKALSKFSKERSVKNIRAINRAIDMHILECDLNINDKELIHIQNNLIIDFENILPTLKLENGLVELKKTFTKYFKIDHSTFDDILNRIVDEEKDVWSISKYIRALSGVDGITITTIHQAKGMEYKAVILDQMNENKIPYQRLIDRNGWVYEPLTDENLVEGKKLFYVGISRAELYLYIFHNWKPSLFLEKIKVI